ncbi:26S proteasome regulatory subunit N11 [Echinococcus multilocularis]|uniref:26S proteasome regulatory subunit N11 n=1 Tax=Echinococcus multilocularis TaxID=6211 RepID=A0A068YDH5_ECHMU|nr:26S proteasome regulatory subunit N11 [Echinococcus multilocularis]
MEPSVKISPTTSQAILLHFALDSTHEMKGILIGSLKLPDVFVVTIIPLSSNQNVNCSVIESRCQDFSRSTGAQLGVVGWYHSHNDLDTALTKQDIDFHLKFKAKFPNSVALVGLFGRRSGDRLARVMSFTAYWCDLNENPVQIQCLIRPLLLSSFPSKYYAVACLTLESVLKIAEEYVSQQKEGSSYLDSTILKPILVTLQSMIVWTNDL